MAQLTIEIPQDLALCLESIALMQKKSMEQVAMERLSSLLQSPGSPSAVLRAMKQNPSIDIDSVDEMETAIRIGSIPVVESDLFKE